MNVFPKPSYFIGAKQMIENLVRQDVPKHAGHIFDAPYSIMGGKGVDGLYMG